MIIQPGQTEQMVNEANRQAMMMQARVNEVMANTAVAVFGSLVANAIKDNDGKDLSLEDTKRLAHQAKEYGPYMAEAFGLITLKKGNENEE